MNLTLEQLELLVAAYRDGEGPNWTDDPYVNWVIDCIEDEYYPYDEALYVAECAALDLQMSFLLTHKPDFKNPVRSIKEAR